MNVKLKNWTKVAFFLVATLIGVPRRQAEGQLRWSYPPKKAPMRVRLVAVAYADHPRSSFFSVKRCSLPKTEVSAGSEC